MRGFENIKKIMGIALSITRLRGRFQWFGEAPNAHRPVSRMGNSTGDQVKTKCLHCGIRMLYQQRDRKFGRFCSEGCQRGERRDPPVIAPPKTEHRRERFLDLTHAEEELLFTLKRSIWKDI